MKKIMITMLLLSLASVAHSEPSSLVAYDRETRAIIRAGDIENGRQLASEDGEDCQDCHSMNGESLDPEDPNIGGLSATYIYKQLQDYKSKKRDERGMYRAVRKLSDQELSDLSAYYASQPIAARANPDAEPPVLVNKGDSKRMIRACNSCHGQNGEGGMYDMPALVGQRKGYFILALEEFKEEDRTNDIYWRMRDVSKQLTEEEIEALAEYYSSADPVVE